MQERTRSNSSRDGHEVRLMGIGVVFNIIDFWKILITSNKTNECQDVISSEKSRFTIKSFSSLSGCGAVVVWIKVVAFEPMKLSNRKVRCSILSRVTVVGCFFVQEYYHTDLVEKDNTRSPKIDTLVVARCQVTIC